MAIREKSHTILIKYKEKIYQISCKKNALPSSAFVN